MIPNWSFRLSMRLYPGGSRQVYEDEMLRTFEMLRGRDGAVSALLRSWRDSFAVGVPMQLKHWPWICDRLRGLYGRRRG